MGKRWGAAAAGAVLFATIGAPAAVPADQGVSETLTGGWVNDAGCVPIGGGPTDDPNVFAVECTGTSLWNGDLAGRTVIRLRGTADTSGRMGGDYEELFVGAFAGDRSAGGLHLKGTFTIDGHGAFEARAAIISGSCAWAGSTGWIAYDGYMLNGGYVGEWTRSAAGGSVDPTCNPADRLPE